MFVFVIKCHYRVFIKHIIIFVCCSGAIGATYRPDVYRINGLNSLRYNRSIKYEPFYTKIVTDLIA